MSRTNKQADKQTNKQTHEQPKTHKDINTTQFITTRRSETTRLNKPIPRPITTTITQTITITRRSEYIHEHFCLGPFCVYSCCLLHNSTDTTHATYTHTRTNTNASTLKGARGHNPNIPKPKHTQSIPEVIPNKEYKYVTTPSTCNLKRRYCLGKSINTISINYICSYFYLELRH